MAVRSVLSLVTLLLLVGVAGCSIGDVRRRPPVPPSPSVVATPSPVAFDEVRRVRVAVDGRYDRPYVEFADARHGYALFAGCDGKPAAADCPALLYATADGGRSWRELRHPRPSATDQQLYTAANLLVLLSEPHGWYTSTDGGATFTHSRSGPPSLWVGAQGRFQVVESTGQVAEWDGRRLRPLASQPGLPGIDSVASRDDRIVVAGLRDGEPFAATSTDGGRSWRRQVVPRPVGEVGVLRAVVDPWGPSWLVGERPDRTGFPALWRENGQGWERVDLRDGPGRVRSIVSMGSGLLAVTGPDGVGMVAGDRFHPMRWPLTPEHHLTVLTDGTLCARGPDDVVLSPGLPVGQRWLRIVLEH